MVGADRSRPSQHRRAVGLGRIDGGPVGVGFVSRHTGPDLLALNDHGLEVGAQASVGEPPVPPPVDQQWIELAEVGRPLDGSGGQAEGGSGSVVMHTGVPAVGLAGQHLGGRSERPGDRVVDAAVQFGVERLRGVVEIVGHGRTVSVGRCLRRVGDSRKDARHEDPHNRGPRRTDR